MTYQPLPPDPAGGYPPFGGHPARPRRRALQGCLIAVGVAGALYMVTGSIAYSFFHPGRSSSVYTSPDTSGRAARSSAPAAHVGDTITITGMSPGEKMAITVTRVLPRARGVQFSVPSRGKRFYAVQFRLTDTGTAAYSDAPGLSAVVVDSIGQSYQADIGDDVSQCQPFPATEHIAVGQSGLGCVTFQVPRNAVIAKVQFTLDAGLGPATGQWQVP